MIRIIQTSARFGKTILRVQADFPDRSVRIVEIDYSEIEERLNKVRDILGREPTERDFVDAVKAIVNEARTARRPLEKTLPLERYINVDLEAEQTWSSQ